MALQYFLYNTDYGNTIVDRSNTSFTPTPPYAEIQIDYFISEIQPLYFYRESGGTIVQNTAENIDAYLSATELPPTAEGNVTYGEFSGTTAVLSAATTTLQTSKVNRSGDTMTGTLRTNSNLLASGTVTGSSVCGGVWVNSPIICGSSCLQSPNIYASTAVFEGGSTICSKYTTKSELNTFTGTTLPANYYNKTQINAYSASTLTNINTRALKTSVATYTGTTAPAQFVGKTAFNTYSGTTIPNTYYNKTQINAYSATTLTNINTRALKTSIATYTGTTAPAAYVRKSGDTMTGTLRITGALSATQRISGSTVYGSTCVYSPITCGSTCVVSPITCGTTCLTTPISCASTRMQSPLVCGSTSVRSPLVTGATVCAGTCLCSIGTTRLVGATTAASTLNVSGITKFANTVCLPKAYYTAPSTGGTLSDYHVVWNPVTKEVRTIASSGGSACVYCYADCRVQQTNGTTVDVTYLTRTWSLPAGTYQMEFNAMFGNDTANRCGIVCFLRNGSIIGSCNLAKTNDTTAIQTAYVTQDDVLTAGSYTFTITHRECGGGLSFINYGAMRVQKIG